MNQYYRVEVLFWLMYMLYTKLLELKIVEWSSRLFGREEERHE